MPESTHPADTPFNPELAVRVLIERVDRLERILRRVADALPAPSPFREPMRESMTGPSVEERLSTIRSVIMENADA